MTGYDGLRRRWLGVVQGLVAALAAGACWPQQAERGGEAEAVISLPEPRRDSGVSVEEALESRRSVRAYSEAALTRAEAGQLLWAAQGITDAEGLRASPSAGATYPLEVYLVVGRVEALAAGVYQYRPEGHALKRVAEGQFQEELAEAALGQRVIAEGAAVIAITGVYERTARRYGKRAERYVHMEAGHAAENVYLQAEALGLGTVAVGAFEDDDVASVLKLAEHERPLYLMPVGHRD